MYENIKTVQMFVQKEIVTDKILNLLEKKLGYEIVGKMRRGCFGEVIEMKKSDPEESFAVKFVPKEKSTPMEVEVWPNLKQKNILRLKETIYIPEDLYLFVTPLQLTTLDLILKQDFLKDSDGLEKIKHWFSGVLSGLQYLHERRLCHCDLKMDNVLINNDMDAIICDFSFLNTTTEPVDRYGLPLIYRPPEVCYSRGFKMKTEGKPYDLWAMGMLVLEVLTDRVLKEKMKGTVLVWSTNVYPLIYKILEVKSFSKRVRRVFPSVKVTDNALEQMRNFITCFLRLDLAHRTPASVARKHVFLGGKFLEKQSTMIWSQKARKESIDRIIAWSVKRDFTVERLDGMVTSEDTLSSQDNYCHKFTYLKNDIDHSENSESEENIDFIDATRSPNHANKCLSNPVANSETPESSEWNEIIARSRELLTVVHKEIQDWKEGTGMVSERKDVSEFAKQAFSSEKKS